MGVLWVSPNETTNLFLGELQCDLDKLGMPIRAGNLKNLPPDLHFRTEPKLGKHESAI